jgi:drug/metabolite transporter (DMT)-like permease
MQNDDIIRLYWGDSMNTWYLAAGSLAVIIGIVHSVLGERLIFHALREVGVVPSRGAPPLSGRHIRILWATWHIASVFGFCFAGLLWWLAFSTESGQIVPLLRNAIIVAYSVSGLLVLLGTRGRHPGWIGLLLVGLFTWLGSGKG